MKEKGRIKMNKLSLCFNPYRSKTYDFITNDTTIACDDLICVTSPVSEKGFAIAAVQEIEENTNDVEHIEIISKVKSCNALVHSLSITDKTTSFHIYLTKEEFYFRESNYTNHIAKQLSYLLDLEFDDYILISDDTVEKYYKLTKSKIPSENYFEVDLLIHKIYINIEEINLDNIEFEYYLRDLTIEIDEEKNEQLKNKLEAIYEFYDDDVPESDDASLLAKRIINETLNDDNIITYRHHGYHLEDKLDDYVFFYKQDDEDRDETFDFLVEKYNIFNNIELEAIENVDIYETFIDSHTIEPLFLTSLSEEDKQKVDSKIPIEGKLLSAGQIDYTYFLESITEDYEDEYDCYSITERYSAMCFYYDDVDKDKLRINVE